MAQIDALKRQAEEEARHPQVKHPRTGHFVRTEETSKTEEAPPITHRNRTAARPPNVIASGGMEREKATNAARRNLGQPSLARQDVEMAEVPSRRSLVSQRNVLDPESLVPRDKLQKALMDAGGARLTEMVLKAKLQGDVLVEDVLSGHSDVHSRVFKDKVWTYDAETKRVVQEEALLRDVSGMVAGIAPEIRMDSLSDKTVQRNPYRERCPYISILTRTGYENALLDTGAEINVMSRDLMIELGLNPFLTPAKFVKRPIGFEGKAGEAFLGMLEGLVIHCGGVECRTHVYVSNTMDPSFRLLLGVPYQVAARAQILRNDDGDCEVVLKDETTGRSITVSASEANYTRDAKTREMIDLAHLNE
jgi:hypothetical protein